MIIFIASIIELLSTRGVFVSFVNPNNFVSENSSYSLADTGGRWLKGQCHGRFRDFWPKFTKFKL